MDFNAPIPAAAHGRHYAMGNGCLAVHGTHLRQPSRLLNTEVIHFGVIIQNRHFLQATANVGRTETVGPIITSAGAISIAGFHDYFMALDGPLTPKIVDKRELVRLGQLSTLKLNRR